MNTKAFDIREWRKNHLRGENIRIITEAKGEKLEMPSVHSEFNMKIKDLNKLGGVKLNFVRKIKKDGDKEEIGKGKINPKTVGFFGQAI